MNSKVNSSPSGSPTGESVQPERPRPASPWIGFDLAIATLLAAALASAQPPMPAPPAQQPPIAPFGPLLIPLIVGTIALIGLIAFVIWRMISRLKKRQRQRST